MLYWKKKKSRDLIYGTIKHTKILYMYIPEFANFDFYGFVPFKNNKSEKNDLYNIYKEIKFEDVNWKDVDCVLISSHEYNKKLSNNIKKLYPSIETLDIYVDASDSLIYILPNLWPVMNPLEVKK